MRKDQQLMKGMKKTPLRLAVEPARRVAKPSVVVLLVAAAIAMAAMTPDGAEAADVPIYSTCRPDNQAGYYHWEVDASGNFNHSIEINECALERLGAGPKDRERVIAHELGHANGLPHSSDPSDIMYPEVPIYGY